MPRFVVEREVPGAGAMSDEQMIRRHAEQAGLPADQVNRVTRVLDPTVTE